MKNNHYKSTIRGRRECSKSVIKPPENGVQAYESDKHFAVSVRNIRRKGMLALGSPPDLSAIKASYMVSLREDLSTIEGLQSEVDFGFAEPRTFEELRRLAHVQAGNAATFGFAALGEAARVVDVHLSDTSNTPELLPSLVAEWRAQLQIACQTY
jgi:HPt (histidine-containing phosphotransfer) domain-containing protein